MGRFIGTAIVIGLIGFAASSPFLFEPSERAVSERPAHESSSSPTPAAPTHSPTPRAEASPEPTPLDARLERRYPRACLRPVARPESRGVIAAYSRGVVRIVSTEGTVLATIRAPGGIVRPPVRWSPSGTVVAIGPQGLFWTPNGEPVYIGDVQHGLVQGPEGTWGWSPLADCGVHVTPEGALMVAAANPFVVGSGATLIERGVESFYFAPDGRKLAVVVADDDRRALWVIDLARNRVDVAATFPASICCVTLGGWDPSSEEVFFWAGPGVSVMADGWPLESVSARGEAEWGRVAPTADLRWCGPRLLATVAGDRSSGRLAELRRDGEPALLGDGGRAMSSFSCSPDDAYIIAATDDARLALLDGDGSFISYPTEVETTNGVWSEGSPEWGPPRTGIVFVRSMHLQIQLWFLGEGTGSPNVVADLLARGSSSARARFDWSATAPTGAPAR